MATINTIDTTAVSDTPTIQITPLHLSVADNTVVSDTPQYATSPGFVKLLGSVVISGYKWLTQTLLVAQQQFNVRPWFTAQILDDTIQPSNSLAFGDGLPMGQSSMATAPDGTVFAVGLDASGNLAVWSDSNLHADGGAWANKVILNTSGFANYDDPRNVFSIAISNYVNSSYHIDVFYFYNFANDGTDLKIGRQYSDDGGNTWNAASWVTTGYVNNTIANLGLAAFKPIWSAGSIVSNCFFIQLDTTFTFPAPTNYQSYNIYYGLGPYIWSQNANSYDWTIHSIGAFYFNGYQYCVFSGFRNILDTPSVNPNYSIWVTRLLNETNGVNDLWSAPVPVMPVGAAAPTNLNSFTFPTATVQSNQVYITFMSTVVSSLSQTAQGDTTQVVTTNTNYTMIQSDDANTFSYPAVWVGTDGTQFNSGSYASFVFQPTGYWYLGGNGILWEYIQNNILADVSEDIIGYQIQEDADQPSSVTLQIANANGKWVGSNPTGIGAAAITGNKKMAISQGYFNANGVPETVPHNVYYIDDVQQNITGTANDLTLIGRDFFKKLKLTVTLFAYQFIGPTFFTDIFDGTNMSLWNQITGQWAFIGSDNPPLLELETSSGSEDKIMYVGSNGYTYGHIYRVFFRNANSGGTSHVFFYALYIDENNWLRLDINTSSGTAWQVVNCIAGSTNVMDSGNLPDALNSSGSHYYGIYIRRYDYFKFNFMIDLYGDGVGNSLFDYDPSSGTTVSYQFAGTGTGEYDLSSVFKANASWQVGFTVGMGTISNGPRQFRFFMFSQLYNPNNLGIVMRSLARLSGIFSFKLPYAWQELFFMPDLTGTYTVKNRQLTLTAGNSAISQDNSMSDGMIQFQAKCTVANSSDNAGFTFIFRNSLDGAGLPEWYQLHVIQASTGSPNPPVYVRFERYVQDINYPTGTTFVFYNSLFDVNNNPNTTFGSFGLNIQAMNTYKVFMVGGWFYAFINDVMVAAWNDNNTTLNYLTAGEWGFGADSNTTLQVQNIQAPDFWKPVQSFSVNPGDDMESDMDSVIQQLRAWYFGDLLGRFKSIFLSSTDPSTYIYDEQLSQQQVDDSNKEFVSQVTVYGQSVSATARNTSLMAGIPTRDMVVVDYTITTEADAQTRANNVLNSQNQYLNQYTPAQVINVGSELFDVVTVINTGNNTSGTDSPTRVYDQTFSEGGGNNNSDYTLELSTGNP